MKSFADWTDDIAQSVGEVKHHWETRKEAELRGAVYNGDIKALEEAFRDESYIEGMAELVLMARCQGCSVNKPDVSMAYSSHGTMPQSCMLCDSCLAICGWNRTP